MSERPYELGAKPLILHERASALDPLITDQRFCRLNTLINLKNLEAVLHRNCGDFTC